ncbi:MAG: DUF378 domain-containing protein [Patescibacteria group bacterium]
MQKLNILDMIALVLVVIGGLNWGLVAFDYNLVGAIFSSIPWLETAVYGLVGLAAVYIAVIFTKLERK